MNNPLKTSPPLVLGTLAVMLAVGGLVFAATVYPADAPDFAYSGDKGPGFWKETSGWGACGGEGGRQSPIDIGRVSIDRRLTPLVLALEKTPIALINNGHVIEEEYEPGSTLVFDGVAYTLTQFHFHTLSEHTVRGQHGAMELHAVFKDPDSNALAVIGMLYTIGRENRFLAELLAHGLPETTGDRVESHDEINLAEGLTETSAYYTYPGSLTTPPCDETVTWIVLKRPAELSESQFQDFRRILGNDFRPLQELNHRVVRATGIGGRGWSPFEDED